MEGRRSLTPVIVWVASFPRSGNTFLRIVLHQLYGIRTSTVYDVDGVATRLGADLIGATERSAPFDQLRAAPEPHFIKTHRQRDADVHDDDRAICLVRDGRDALVSWARQASEDDPSCYERELRSKILNRDLVGTGSWGRSVLSWLTPSAPHRILLRYEDLTRAPAATVTSIVTKLTPTIAAAPGATLPSFEQLHRTDHRFFRRGRTGSHREELPDELHRLFWSRTDNAEAMDLLGYPTSELDTR